MRPSGYEDVAGGYGHDVQEGHDERGGEDRVGIGIECGGVGIGGDRGGFGRVGGGDATEGAGCWVVVF